MKKKTRSSKVSVGTDSRKVLRAAQARLKAYEQETARKSCTQPIVSRSVWQNCLHTPLKTQH